MTPATKEASGLSHAGETSKRTIITINRIVIITINRIAIITINIIAIITIDIIAIITINRLAIITINRIGARRRSERRPRSEPWRVRKQPVKINIQN